MQTPILAWHGGQHAAPRWFTTDPGHAAYFGEVRQYRLYPRAVLEIDMTHPALRDEQGYELMGYEADDALYRLLESSGVDAILVHGWEGSGVCILRSDSCEYEEI